MCLRSPTPRVICISRLSAGDNARAADLPRLCDQPPGSETTKQRSEELLHITERYMSAMPKPPGIPADRFFSGPILQSWLTIYA